MIILTHLLAITLGCQRWAILEFTFPKLIRLKGTQVSKTLETPKISNKNMTLALSFFL